LIQASNVAFSGSLSGGFGGGGIGVFGLWMRVATSSYTFLSGVRTPCAWKFAHVTSGIGAVNCGGFV
jgi:hypothetical protein